MNLKFDIKSLLKKKPAVSDGGISSSPSRGSEQVRSAVIWVKSNLLVLSLATVAFLALGIGYYFSSEMFAANEQAATTLGAKVEALSKLQRSPVSIVIPGNDAVTGNVVVNRKLVDAVKVGMATANSAGSGSSTIMNSAVKHNSKGHAPIMSLRLKPNDQQLAQVHLDMFDKLQERYAKLLESCRATLPPSEEDVRVELQRAKLRFIQADLSKNVDMPLTPQEQAKLVEDLKSRRLAAYCDCAKNAGLYADMFDLGAPRVAPVEDNADKRLEKLWDLQWKFWVAEDIVRAFAKLNEGESISTGPVKRIVGIHFSGRVVGAGLAGVEGQAPPAEEVPSESGEPGSEGAVVSTGAFIDTSQVVPVSDFSTSFQGWSSNQLYDVYKVTLRFVAETSKIPSVTNALARQNFMAITNIRIVPADQFEAIRSGYFYGVNPVSVVTMNLESAWLRQWTGPLMPDVVRQKFGTTGQVAASTRPDGAANGG